MTTMNDSLAHLTRGVLGRVRALEADPYGDHDLIGELGKLDDDLQVILSLLGLVKTIPAGTMGALGDEEGAPVVAVIELTQAELEKLTEVCGHDGFGMLPEAAAAILGREL
jgi:hypothetical protein